MVYPGEAIASSEEMLPGEGTFDTGENICSYYAGDLDIDTKNFSARVNAKGSTPVVLKEGDVVIGEIRMVKSSMAVVELVKKAGEKRRITGETEATLRVANAAEQYVPELTKAYKKRDVVRAVVVSKAPSLQISTKGAALGCLNALCTKCGKTLEKKEKELWCADCERSETRKTANDYGEGALDRTNI
ncbi:MAG: RNA-binding protein [Thermoplasmata archaeon HGW-Thermoplasmata-1]|nr:MAG: RNA-binding protein [Thermoplasmata archaeon HGW-Thermoplasmata-1]